MAQGVLMDVDAIVERLGRGERLIVSVRADVLQQLTVRLLLLGIEVEG